jgi:predicted RNase H-related nuclease YkuK (DUF458 family)
MENLALWRRLSDRKEVELLPYLRSWVEKNPDHKIYIGCDSHNAAKKTTFATVIVLHHRNGNGNGGHVLYRRESFPLIKDKYYRLWKEVEFSVGAAQFMMEFGFEKPAYIDVDLNPDPRFHSNSVLRAAVGLIQSLGIEARHKGESPWAISIAEVICK